MLKYIDNIYQKSYLISVIREDKDETEEEGNNNDNRNSKRIHSVRLFVS